MALQMTRLKFVGNTISKPRDKDPLYFAWKQCKTLVLSWLNHRVSHEIAANIIWINDDKDV
ncbi:hypothetical protein HKD37_06G014890 [Glycine soja]